MLPGAHFDIQIDAGASFNLTKQTDENGEVEAGAGVDLDIEGGAGRCV